MFNGYFEIRLVRVSKQKGENKNTNSKPINSNNNMESSWWYGGWSASGGTTPNLGSYPCQLGPGQGRAGQLGLQLGLGWVLTISLIISILCDLIRFQQDQFLYSYNLLNNFRLALVRFLLPVLICIFHSDISYQTNCIRKYLCYSD